MDFGFTQDTHLPPKVISVKSTSNPMRGKVCVSESLHAHCVPRKEGHRWNHHHETWVGKVVPILQEVPRLCQSWRAVEVPPKTSSHPDLSKKLAVEVPQSHSSYHPVTVTTKQVVLLELTVPWEECLDERKLSKYVGLVRDCQQAGWRTNYFPVKVGCRGFTGQSLQQSGYRRREKEESHSQSSPKQQKGPQNGLVTTVVSQLDTSWGLISPRYFTRKHPVIPGASLIMCPVASENMF